MKRPLFLDTPLYNAYKKDSDHEYLDGSKYKYVLKFDKDHLPITAFWSLTVYRLSGSFRKNDPIRRYLIHSPLFSSLAKDDDGGLTIYFQRDSPGHDKEVNWLPPPRDLFFVVMRIYLPMKEATKINLGGTFVKKQPNTLYVANRNEFSKDLITGFNNMKQFRRG